MKKKKIRAFSSSFLLVRFFYWNRKVCCCNISRNIANEILEIKLKKQKQKWVKRRTAFNADRRTRIETLRQLKKEKNNLKIEMEKPAVYTYVLSSMYIVYCL